MCQFKAQCNYVFLIKSLNVEKNDSRIEKKSPLLIYSLSIISRRWGHYFRRYQYLRIVNDINALSFFDGFRY